MMTFLGLTPIEPTTHRQAAVTALLLVMALVMLAALGRLLRPFAGRRGSDATPGVCGHCGYSLRGLPSTICPECGSDTAVVGVSRPSRNPGAGRWIACALWIAVLLIFNRNFRWEIDTYFLRLLWAIPYGHHPCVARRSISICRAPPPTPHRRPDGGRRDGHPLRLAEVEVAMNSAIDEISLNSPRRPPRADSAIGAGSRRALTSRADCGDFFLGFGVLSGYERCARPQGRLHMMNRGFRLIAVSMLTSIVAAFAVPPLHAAVPPPTDASVKRQKWVEKEVLKAYDEVGRRNAKWDEAARQALRLTVDEWSGVRPRLDGAFAQFQAAKRAVEAGCDDPMILYVYAETYKTFGDDAQKCRDLHNQAADAFPGTDYSGYYKSMAQFRAAQLQFEMANEHGRAAGKYNMDELNAGMRRIAVGIGNMVELSHETDVPMGKWINLGYAMQDAMVFTSGGDQAVRWALPEIEKRAPKLAALVIKGELYTHWAWDARGSDFANKVTDEGWKLMASRLQTAQMALEEAWKLDPTCIDIPIRMITLELGQGQGRDRMELWFKRAMAIDPDSENACEAKLYYLEPKWYGTPRDVIQFGHECLQTGRFNSNVPRMLERAHKTLSHYTHGGYSTKSDPAYYRLPGVWADLQAVYEGYLAADKDLHPTHLRNEYARYACLCGAWDDATKIFATIGDDVDPGVWTKEQFEAARKAAANGAK